MISFKDSPIKYKLMIVSICAASVALVLSSIIIVGIEHFEKRKIYLNELSIQAQIIGKNSVASLLFNDVKSANEVISSLKINPNITDAALFDSSNKLFVSYEKDGVHATSEYPVLSKNGYKIGINYLALMQPILFDNEIVGSIYIRASMREVYYYLVRVTSTVILAVAAALFLVFLFLIKQQEMIVKPLIDLSGLMRKISNDKDYSLRAATNSGDEIGMLANGFNEMLDHIQRRDVELEQHGKYLEDQVRKRTEAISQMNIKLRDDLEERKKMEKALRELEHKYRNLFDNLNDAAFLFDLMTDEIVETNLKGESLLGMSREEFIGAKHRIIYPATVDFEDIMRCCLKEQTKGVIRNIETEIIRKDGRIVPVEISVSIVSIKNNNMMLGLFRDITDRKEAENKIKSSLEEKKLLLKEIHHRVKNNMQVIASLLYLQSENIKDSSAKEIFRESETRVKSMALIHERLYQTEDLANVDFESYVTSLTAHLFSTYNCNNDSVKCVLNIKKVFLAIDVAIPCGLIVNELVSNALKYAFIDDRKGEIYIDLYEETENASEVNETLSRFVLAVRDNGIGIPGGFDYKKSKSLGLRLVNALVHQLEGHIELNSTGGTEFKVVFFGKEAKE